MSLSEISLWVPKTKWECLTIVKGSEDNNIGNGTGNANKGREAKRTPLEPGSPVPPKPSEFFLTPPLQGTWPTLPVNDLMVAADALWRMQLKNWCKSARCTAMVFRKLASEERWSLCILFMCLEFGYNVFELFVPLGSVITSLELPGDSLVAGYTLAGWKSQSYGPHGRWRQQWRATLPFPCTLLI